MGEEGDEDGGDATHRYTTPIAMVLHLDEEEEEDEEDEGDEGEEGEGEGDEEEEEEEESDDKGAAAAASNNEEDDNEEEEEEEEAGEEAEDHGGGEEVRIDTEGRIAGVSDCGLDFRFRSFPFAVCPPTSVGLSVQVDKLKVVAPTSLKPRGF